MSNYEKFIEKLLQRPTRTDITFEEAYSFLTSQRVGFNVKFTGSHCNFRKKGIHSITIPRKNLMHYSIEHIIEALQELGLID